MSATPPEHIYSEESEVAVIAAVLSDPDQYRLVSSMIDASDFFLIRNAHIWNAISRIATRENSTLDRLTLSEELRGMGILNDIGGDDYLLTVRYNTPNPKAAPVYAGMVAAKSTRRRALKMVADSAALIHDDSITTEDMVMLMQEAFLSIKKRIVKKRGKLLKDVISDIWEDFERLQAADRDYIGVATGFADYDAQIGGMEKTDLIIFAGRPGMGKSSIVANIAVNVARRETENHVAYFLNEMSNKDTAWRALSRETGINSRLLKQPRRLTPAEVNRVIAGFGRLSSLPINLDDKPYNTGQLYAEVDWLQRTWGVDLVIIDGLYRVPYRGHATQRWEQFGEMAQALKTMAIELDVPVLVTHQLNRELEKRQDKRPMMSDLAESGRIEQEADVITMLYRDAYYNPDTTLTPNAVELITVKNRDGQVGTVTMHFDAATNAFSNAATRTVDLRSNGQ